MTVDLKDWRRIHGRRVSRRIKLGKTKKYRNFGIIKGEESKCSRELKNVVKTFGNGKEHRNFNLTRN